MSESHLSMSPPTAAETRLPDQKSSWPTVVGVIGIVIASLGLLSTVCGGAWLALQPLLPPEFTSSQPDFGTGYLVTQIVGYVVGLPMSIWLLMSSIGVLKRRARAARALKWWAIVDIAYVVLSLGFSMVFVVGGIARVVEENPQAPPGVLYGSMLGGMVLGVLFGLAWPVFVVIWLRRGRIRAEVAAWP